MWPVLPRKIGSDALPTLNGHRRGRARDAQRTRHERRQDVRRDVVEHDRRDDLVGAR